MRSCLSGSLRFSGDAESGAVLQVLRERQSGVWLKHIGGQTDPSRLSDRAKRDKELNPEIERVFEEHHSVYGVRKIWHQMRREGFGIARCTVARQMKDTGIEGVVGAKKPKTTIPDKAMPCPLDKLNRQFHALWRR
ncbi:IS3 family transposase [Phaeobacter marinintestinus]|uniref:IS3 family transposase n=1 Tax=Falsiphaeobacter marinintestinus TaxID=1492905 RepID=UPI0011B3C8F7